VDSREPLALEASYSISYLNTLIFLKKAHETHKKTKKEKLK
jgi:hypothetical protein